MIKANELRIGNWYNCANPMEGGKLYPNQFTNWTDYLDFEAYGESIPLTPEVLEKCGFKHKGAWMGKSFITPIYDEDVEMVFEFMDNNLNVYAYDRRVRRIKSPSLHQLQNLFFCLTGEELPYQQLNP